MAKMNDDPHICSECYEVSLGWHEVANGKKVCDDCGGTVLDLQEAADKIAELKAELNFIKGID